MSGGLAFDALSRLREAIALHRQGRLAEAERLYRDILAHMPDQPDALHFLGVLEAQQGRHKSALQWMDRAVAANPRHAAILYNRANLLRDMGRSDEALAGYDAALAVKPDNIAALTNKGALLHTLGRYGDAVACYDRILTLKPDYADAHANRGNALAALGRHEEALACFEKGLTAQPDHFASLFGKSNTLTKLGRAMDALAIYDRALRLEPNNSGLLNNLGLALIQLNRYDEALANFDRAIAVSPGTAESFANRGTVFMQFRNFEAALQTCKKALELRPDDPDALYGCGSALVELNRHDEAIAAFEQLMRVRPDYPYGLGMLVYAQRTACDWRDGSATVAMLDAIEAGKRATTPLVLLAVSDSAPLKLRCAQTLIQHKFPAPREPLWRGETYRRERIRLAYLSADFRDHPVAILTAGLFEHHDRTRFETIALSYGPDDRSSLRARLIRAFDRFIDIQGKSDFDVARLIRDMEIDILVDLTGLTASARPAILALRPAPVQVNYLGFAGTLGAYADYIIADRTVIPEEQQPFYTEKMVYLPDSYMPHDSQRRIAERLPRRDELGLPEAGFVFASFNNPYKFAPAIFDIWMRLLHRIEGSVLWLSAANPAAQRNLQREAETRSIAKSRIVFAPRLPAPEDHLARLAAADLFLDTLPYNAHTTACDALWAGLPVLTCKGESFAGRVAASLLSACGLPELIADSLTVYEGKALALASDANALTQVKEKLRRGRDSCALFDTARFTRNLERAYTAMWQRSVRGEPPANISLDAAPPP
ncbi:MAG TPA: tetratricopeptide repeat protein [Micropepsaceae bacterium]|nr:tetratricopeptide repeat protein [Micropepsaceae bacterium]